MRWWWQKPLSKGQELLKHLIKKGCFVCGNRPFTMYEGPSGGASQNVWCGECGTRYNITPLIGGGGWAELITERERETEFKKRRKPEGSLSEYRS